MSELREDLETILEVGIASDPLDHSRQIAAIAAVLFRAFENAGLLCTLVGGSAIEVYAPGIFASGDIDLVIEAHAGRARERAAQVFQQLGFDSQGRHWSKGTLFVEVPGHSMEDPADVVQVGPFVFRIIAKEALLVQRLVGFKYWKQTAYGQQAIDMVAAFGDQLNHEILGQLVQREDVSDALEAIRSLADTDEPVTEATLQEVLQQLARPR